jgi:hypothetical protein
MKLILSFILLAVVSANSCKKANEPVANLNGTYKGTFQRKVSGAGDAANVTLNFSADKWNGQSQTAKYPALSEGTFSIKGDSISFKNESMWTAEFDWSLILNGGYQLKSSGKNLVISKTYSNGNVDVYTLAKQ